MQRSHNIKNAPIVISRRSLDLSVTAYHLSESLAVELLFGLNDAKNLSSWQYLTEFQVILLLEFLNLDIQFVLGADGIHAGLVVARVGMAIPLHLVEQQTLLTLHLLVQGEKLCRFLRREGSLGRNILFELGLKLLWVKPWAFLRTQTKRAQDDNQYEQ